jgi:hypothetical protein
MPRAAWRAYDTATNRIVAAATASPRRAPCHSGDIEVVALRVAEISRTAGEELRVDWLFGHAGAGVAHLLRQPVDLVGGVDHHADGEADASAAGRLGSAFPSRASWVVGNSASTMPRSSNANMLSPQ